MSYPYGPEPYPTWESLERWHDAFANALYAERGHARQTMLERRRERARNRPITINITVNGGTDEETLDETVRRAVEETQAGDECQELDEREEMDAWGLAFARALEQAGIDCTDADRLFRDLCNILEDKVIGGVNEKAREEARENGWY